MVKIRTAVRGMNQRLSCRDFLFVSFVFFVVILLSFVRHAGDPKPTLNDPLKIDSPPSLWSIFDQLPSTVARGEPEKMIATGSFRRFLSDFFVSSTIGTLLASIRSTLQFSTRDGNMILRTPQQKTSNQSHGSELLCRSILIVEDTRAISFLISQYLRGLAENIDIACDGHDAVRQVVRAHDSHQPYGLILMDLQMPIMSGLEATTAIRNRGIPTPIVAMTAGNLDPQRCRDAGCDGYLLKPIDRLNFLRYLRSLLD